jgi:OPA family glycerol-3-phosphate transporter-like MFS transporter/OPA family sugar phosphate sensor protein UhpC-like MFS transporter
VNGASADSAESGVTVGRMVFRNPVVWILCGANFSLNLVRFVILDWGPMLLKEFKGLSLAKASWVVALYEIAGVAGMIFAGWATDRWAKGRGNRVCFFMMLGSALAMVVFLLVPGSTGIVPLLATLAVAGFFIYGPQTLTGSILTNIATKRFAGTAIGLNAIFSYASVIFTGVGMGALADRFGGWTVPLVCVIGVAVFGSLVFLSLWRTPANSYDKGFETTDDERSKRQ